MTLVPLLITLMAFWLPGTTVSQEMLWLLSHDLEYEKAAQTHLVNRAPFLESNVFIHDEILTKLVDVQDGNPEMQKVTKDAFQCKIPFLNQQTLPRVLKSHFPLSLLSPKLLETSKVVYMCRNPKDVAVSHYLLARNLVVSGYVGDFPKYWDYFQRNLLQWTPYWEHIREAWEQREHPNLLFLFYEDLVNDMEGTVRKAARHLGKNLTTEQVTRLAQHLHIDNFRKNPSTNPENLIRLGLKVGDKVEAIRKGKNHGWTEYFTPDMNVSADIWIKENMKQIPEFKFPDV